MNRLEQGLGWVSPKIAVVVPGDGTVKVVDAVTLHFLKGPAEARFLRDDEKRLIVKWSIPDPKTNDGISFAHFDYRVSIARADGKIELTAGPRTFGSNFRSSGQCRLRHQ